MVESGRHAGFRCRCSKERGGSSPSARTAARRVACGAYPGESIDLLAMEAGAIRPGYELWRPNREKPEAKSARALVVFLLLVSAALAFVITLGGWTRLEGVKAFAARSSSRSTCCSPSWSRAGTAASCPWHRPWRSSSRSSPGSPPPPGSTGRRTVSSDPALPPDLLGLLTLLLVPLQVILIAVAMVAFNQDWHVEEERPIGDEIPPAEPAEDEGPTESRSTGRRSGSSRSSRSTRSTRGAATRRPRKA